MILNHNTPVVGVSPRISKERFKSILEAHNSPASSTAYEGYERVLARGVDPLFALTIFWHENKFATHPNSVESRNQTKNPGMRRTSRNGKGWTILDVERGTAYQKYETWADGWDDLAFALVDQSFVYAQQQRTTVGEILPVYAPPSDSNDPNAYINDVTNRMNEWYENVTETIFGTPFRRSHIPPRNPNRPGGNYQKTIIVNHETANTNIGANAEMHRVFTHNGGGVHNVSFTYTVDDKEIIELVPSHEKTWHGGDGASGKCNVHAISIELCVNADGDWKKTLENGARLNAWLLKQHNLTPPDVVWQHYDCSKKNCPARLRASGWDQYKNRIIALYQDRPQDDTLSLPKHPDLDASFHPEHGFGGYMRWLISRVGKQEALLLVGYPITDEFEEDGRVVQYTERMRFEWHKGARPDRFDVLIGRTAAELLEARAEIRRLTSEIEQLRAERDS